MSPGNEYCRWLYIEKLKEYVYSLSILRRIMCRFSDKYRVSKKEFEEWFYKELLK